ncbi:hypothetical protein DIPPA_30219 [Diplonema papillatum]|nr:hypothetical protein DIPPA_30219 [Diplonema papillatum]
MVLKPPRGSFWRTQLMDETDETSACNISENEFFLQFAGVTYKDQKLVNIACKDLGFTDGSSTVATSGELYDKKWVLFKFERCISVMFFCIRLFASATVSVGVGWSSEIDLMEQSVAVGLMPFSKVSLVLSGSVDLFLAKATVQLDAAIADIKFPLDLYLLATEFPINVCMEGNLEIQPLTVDISFQVAIRDKFEIGWFYIKWTWGSKWRFVLYSWRAPQVVLPLFSTCRGTSDVSVPRPRRVTVAQTGPYVGGLGVDMTYSKDLGEAETIVVAAIRGDNGERTDAVAGDTSGRVKGLFDGVDGDAIAVLLRTVTHINVKGSTAQNRV